MTEPLRTRRKTPFFVASHPSSLLQRLWCQGALVPGGIARLPGATTPRPRRPPPTRPHSHHHRTHEAARREHAITSPHFNANLMANPVLREALLHLRTALPGLTDYATLERMCGSYAQERSALFSRARGRARGQEGRQDGEGVSEGEQEDEEDEEGEGQGAPEVLFNAGVGKGVRRAVNVYFREVLHALRLPPNKVRQRVERQARERQQQEAEEAERAAAAAAAAARPRTLAEALAAVAARPPASGRGVAGELGALMRRRAAASGGAGQQGVLAAAEPAAAAAAGAAGAAQDAAQQRGRRNAAVRHR